MDKTINAELPHPEIMGPPLDRGIRYGHHFVVELISDGRRLWAVASEEGRRLMSNIASGIENDDPPTEAVGGQSGTDPEPVPNQSGIGGEAPTTTTAPANSFDS